MPGEIIVGLDIGTTKICAVVGEVHPGGVEIIGTGSHPSDGLRKGVVINIEHTVDSIKEAVEEAETMAGCEISSVYAGIAGGHIKGFNSEGVIALKEKEVTKKISNVSLKPRVQWPSPWTVRLFIPLSRNSLWMTRMESLILWECPVFVWRRKYIS